jgi:hypothetical protein
MNKGIDNWRRNVRDCWLWKLRENKYGTTAGATGQ